MRIYLETLDCTLWCCRCFHRSNIHANLCISIDFYCSLHRRRLFCGIFNNWTKRNHYDNYFRGAGLLKFSYDGIRYFALLSWNTNYSLGHNCQFDWSIWERQNLIRRKQAMQVERIVQVSNWSGRLNSSCNSDCSCGTWRLCS